MINLISKNVKFGFSFEVIHQQFWQPIFWIWEWNLKCHAQNNHRHLSRHSAIQCFDAELKLNCEICFQITFYWSTFFLSLDLYLSLRATKEQIMIYICSPKCLVCSILTFWLTEDWNISFFNCLISFWKCPFLSFKSALYF